MSGPFKVQTGLNTAGQPTYANCGELNLYKTNATGGREWRLEDTCEQLLDVMVPTYSPTPAPTGIITPTPTPKPGATSSGECTDGFLTKANSTQWTLTNVVLTLAKTHTWCVDLPASTRPFFEVKTVNKGNSSCSDLEMLVISPSGVEYFSNGSQPGVPPFQQAGRWKIKLHLNEGCNRYDLSVVY